VCGILIPIIERYCETLLWKRINLAGTNVEVRKMTNMERILPFIIILGLGLLTDGKHYHNLLTLINSINMF
jgi:hypothetical protein